MENYKKAAKQKLRVATQVGLLSVEQLFDLSLTDLDTLAVSLEKQYEQSKGKSFLDVQSKKDASLKLSFDIVLDILLSKKSDQDKASRAADTRARNQKILGLIADKQDDELKGKSLAELEAML